MDVTLSRWTIEVEYELLGNIPTVDKTTMNLGETVTVTINRIIADSTTSLTYKIGDTVLKTIDLETGTTDSYKALATVGGNFPNALTGTLVIEATTSKDGTTYGVITTTVVLTIPENGAPLLNCGVGQVWGSDVPSSAKLSAFVQSRTGAMLNGQFIAQYGASTAKLVFKIEGVEYEKDMAGLPQTSISGPSAITGSGTIPWSATLTDSRGLSTTRTGSITVLPYSAPKIQSFSVSRADENGKTIIDGTYAYISLQASVSSLVVSNVEKNALSFHVEYKKADETDWTVCDTVTGSSISGAFSGLLMKNGAAISNFDDLSGYSFRAVVSDIYGSSAAQDEMPTKEQIWDIDESTGNMGFGGDAPLSTDGAGYRFYRFVDFSAGYKKYSEDEVDTGNVWIDGKPNLPRVRQNHKQPCKRNRCGCYPAERRADADQPECVCEIPRRRRLEKRADLVSREPELERAGLYCRKRSEYGLRLRVGGREAGGCDCRIHEGGMNLAEANALIAVARSQIGYLEKKSNAKLEEFTANAGNKNFTKYNRDYIAWCGSGAIDMQWCAAFVSWCFVKAYGLDTAKKLAVRRTASVHADRRGAILEGRIATFAADKVSRGPATWSISIQRRRGESVMSGLWFRRIRNTWLRSKAIRPARTG